ncbi:MAG: RluA family pseudouridine synthase [Casimicrobiaceae bacterium]
MNELSKDAVAWLTIGEESAGQRVDNFLVRILKGVPKSHIYRIVRSGEVRVNKGRVGADTRLAEGDVVRVPPVRLAEPDFRPPIRRAAAPLPVVFEDEALVAIDKPAGLAVHGGSGISFGVIEQLRSDRPDASFLELVHRLDRDTSGLLLVAKKRVALLGLHSQLREGAFDKRYLTLARGRWRDAKRAVRLPLQKLAAPGGERRVRVEPQGAEALTVFRRVQTWNGHVPPLALLDAELKTGRTHQIRVHLAHLGFPIAGDDKYGDFEWNRALARVGLKRMFLHAATLAFEHPLSGVRMSLQSPLPGELAAYLEGLGPANQDARADG